MTLSNDEALFEAVWQALKPERAGEVRLAVIDNTLHLERLWLSESLLGALKDGQEAVGEPFPLRFDAGGRMIVWAKS